MWISGKLMKDGRKQRNEAVRKGRKIQELKETLRDLNMDEEEWKNSGKNAVISKWEGRNRGREAEGRKGKLT